MVFWSGWCTYCHADLFRVLTSIAKGKKTLMLPRLAGHADRQADDMWLPGSGRRCYACLQVGAARRGVCPAGATCTFYGCSGRMVNYNEDAGGYFTCFIKAPSVLFCIDVYKWSRLGLITFRGEEKTFRWRMGSWMTLLWYRRNELRWKWSRC